MGHGGKRPAAGRKRGGKNKTTLAKAAVEAEYRAFMVAHQRPLWRAQLARAAGAYVCLVKTKIGYRRVTDEVEIAKVMATSKPGDGYYLIEAQAADAQMAKEVNNRLMGMPVQPVDLGTADGDALPVRIVMRELP